MAEVSQPCIGSLDLPTFAIAAQGTSVLCCLANPASSVRHDQLDASLLQSCSQRVAVVGPVANQPLRFLPRTAAPTSVRDADRCKGGFREFDFRRGGRSQVVSQRNTLAIDHHHPLCTLAALGFADSSAPFFAEAKLPSINASLQSNKPLRFSSPRNVRQIVSHTSCSSQSCSRRQHVAGEGYSAGRSCHLAPLRAIHKMPSNTRRLSDQGRPPRLLLRNLGSNGMIFSHCRSVNIGPPRGIQSSSCHLIAQCQPPRQVPPSIQNQVMKQLLVHG